MGWGSGSSRLPYLITPQRLLQYYLKGRFYITDSFPSGITATADDIAIVFISADSGEKLHHSGGKTLAIDWIRAFIVA